MWHKKLQRQKQAANHGYVPQPSLHLCHNSPLPYFGRRQMTGICYLDDIQRVCLTFMLFSRELALRDLPQQLALLSAAGREVPAWPAHPGSRLCLGNGSRGAKRRHTAQLIIIFKMFQEPQKQIK